MIDDEANGKTGRQRLLEVASRGEYASASELQLDAAASLQFGLARGSITKGKLLNFEQNGVQGRAAGWSTSTVFGPVRLMIDTLHVIIPVIVTRPVVGGWRTRHNEAGRFDWEVSEDVKMEGTWGTSILAHHVTVDGRRVSDDETLAGSWQGDIRPHKVYLKVMGSAVKHATGQNAFGTSDMETVLLYFLEVVRQHPSVYEVDELAVWKEARITKLDVAGIVSINEHDKLWFLDYISKHAVVRGKQKQINGVLRGNTTWYSHIADGKGTQVIHQLKIYSKHEDITKHQKRGGVNRQLFYFPQIEEDAKKWLRIERAMHTKALRKYAEDTPSYFTPARLVELWEMGVMDVSWPDFTRGDVHALIGQGELSSGAYASLYGWLAGDDPFGCAKRGTLYRAGGAVGASTLRRHRLEILKASKNRIDIKNPRAVDTAPEVVRVVRLGAVQVPSYLAPLPLVA